MTVLPAPRPSPRTPRRRATRGDSALVAQYIRELARPVRNVEPLVARRVQPKEARA